MRLPSHALSIILMCMRYFIWPLLMYTYSSFFLFVLVIYLYLKALSINTQQLYKKTHTGTEYILCIRSCNKYMIYIYTHTYKL